MSFSQAMHDSQSWLSAIATDCSRSNGSSSPSQIASTNRLISPDSTGSLPRNAASPCRRALRLERALPALVRGPRLLQPLIRLTAIFFEELIAHHHLDRRLIIRLLWSRGTRPR